RYHVSPFTYLIEGVLAQAICGQNITCSSVELVAILPPTGTGMDPFISYAGGYLTDDKARLYYSTSTTDQFPKSQLNMYYEHRGRNFGAFTEFSAVNLRFGAGKRLWTDVLFRSF
ncbi:hypothetical protein C8J56DRAFT_801781, partial [Mycena floridula]